MTPVTDENRDRIQVHLPNPYYPPKRFVLPHIERLLKVRAAAMARLQIEPTYRERKRAIFGIRSCDVAGIWHLDRFYLGRELPRYLLREAPEEPVPGQRRLHRSGARISARSVSACAPTPARRRATILICSSWTWATEFMAVAGTPAGEALFAEPDVQEGHAGACREAPRHPGRGPQAV